MSSLDTTGLLAGRLASPPNGMTAMRATSLGCTKLRDSCHSCASSKIKCTKEKPSCSRCASRGIDCQYSYARRPGRRRENSTGHPNSCTSRNDTSVVSTNEPTSVLGSIPNLTNSRPSLSRAGPKPNTDNELQVLTSGNEDTVETRPPYPHSLLTSNSAISATSMPEGNSFTDPSASFTISTSLFSSNTPQTFSPKAHSMFMDGTDMFSHLPELALDINDMDFVMSDTFFDYPATDGQVSSRGNTHTSNDLDSLLTADKSIDFTMGTSEVGQFTRASSATLPDSSSELPSVSSGVPAPFTAQSNAVSAAPIEHTCDCVTQALDILQSLSSVQPPLLSTHANTDTMLLPTMTDVGLGKAVVSESKQNIKAITKMLACHSCDGNTFLLTILSMAILKIVERCANMARPHLYNTRGGPATFDTVPRLADSIITSSNYHMRPSSRAGSVSHDDSTDGSIPAQLMLGELQCAKMLVKELSSELNKSSDLNGRELELDTGGVTQAAGETDDPVPTHFTLNILAQLEIDLRKSLMSLSKETMNLLS